MSEKIQEIPAGAGLHKIAQGEGRAFDIAGAHFTWKARNEDTGHAFSLYEMALEPGEGVPLHCHPYVEVFYILAGEVEFFRPAEDGDRWIAASCGETVIVPINGLHAFYNRSRSSARLLSVSNQLHQPLFDALDDLDKVEPFSAFPMPEAMGRVAALAKTYGMHFLPFQPPSSTEDANDIHVLE